VSTAVGDTTTPVAVDPYYSAYNHAANFVTAVALSAGEVGLPKTVCSVLSVAAEVVTTARMGHGDVTPEVDALRLGLLQIIARAEFLRQQVA
jgi:hypothetical protein